MRYSLFQTFCYVPAQSIFRTAKWLLMSAVSLAANATMMMAEVVTSNHTQVNLLQKMNEIEEEERPLPLEHYIAAAMAGYFGGLTISAATYCIVRRKIKSESGLVEAFGMAFRGDILATFIITTTVTGFAIALDPGLVPVGVINLMMGILLTGTSIEYIWRYRREQNSLLAQDRLARSDAQTNYQTMSTDEKGTKRRGTKILVPGSDGQPPIYEAGDDDDQPSQYAKEFTA